jgi:hypothetical protein
MDSIESAGPRRRAALTVLIPEPLRQATEKAAANEYCSMSDIIRGALLCKLHADGLLTFDDLTRPAA